MVSEEKRLGQENGKEDTLGIEYMKSEMIKMISSIMSPSVIARCYQYIKYIYLHNS